MQEDGNKVNPRPPTIFSKHFVYPKPSNESNIIKNIFNNNIKTGDNNSTLNVF